METIKRLENIKKYLTFQVKNAKEDIEKEEDRGIKKYLKGLVYGLEMALREIDYEILEVECEEEEDV